ncbi:MAG TPA: protein kinase [Polyangiaceae bacterium]|nr:protein kinase [Polyangiaceae bacterium]
MNREEQLAGVTEGLILAGKYRVDKVLGIGGMGVVVAAHHIQLDDRVAIKFLLPETLGNADAVMRFAREARAAVKIKSEHVARVTDVGTLENGAPYMVMEYLEGGDLSAWLTERGRLPVEQAVDLLLQACEAIAEAHAIGIVHRDLKPANLFVARLPGGVQSVKVLDFGISKLTGFSASGGESSATKTSALLGSPLYMSPEQMRSSKDVDARGDIWALGVILYELLAGAAPFIADSMPELVFKIVDGAPVPLLQVRPDVPAGLETVIFRCLEKDRSRRFQTVGDLAGALGPYAPRKSRASIDRIAQVMQAAGMSATSPAPSVPPVASAAPAVGVSTVTAFGKTAAGSSRAKPALIAAGLLSVLAAVAALTLRPRAAADSKQASAPSIADSGTIAQAPSPSPPSALAEVIASTTPVPAAASAPASASASASASAPASPLGPARSLKPAPRPPRSPAAAPAAPRTAAESTRAPAITKKPSDDSLIDDRQ